MSSETPSTHTPEHPSDHGSPVQVTEVQVEQHTEHAHAEQTASDGKQELSDMKLVVLESAELANRSANMATNAGAELKTATKDLIHSRRHAGLVKKFQAALKAGPSQRAWDEVRSYFIEFAGPDGEEDFHRTLRRLKVQYHCSFEEERGEEEPRGAERDIAEQLNRLPPVFLRRGIERRAAGFLLVEYDIPRGCIGAYYPETNPLVPLDSVGDVCNTPTSKSIPVLLQRAA